MMLRAELVPHRNNTREAYPESSFLNGDATGTFGFVNIPLD